VIVWGVSWAWAVAAMATKLADRAKREREKRGCIREGKKTEYGPGANKSELIEDDEFFVLRSGSTVVLRPHA